MPIKMKQILLLFLLLPAILFSQEKTNFSLQEAVSYAENNAYAVLNATDDITKAKHRVWETTTMGLPQINGSVDYKNFIVQPVQLIPAELFGGPAGQFAEMTFGTKQDVSATATLTQLIFDGSYLVGLQSAKVYQEISENIKEKTTVAIKQAVTNAYAGILMTDEGIKIIQKNKTTLEKTIHDTQEIYKNGFAEEQDVEQLQLTLSSINNELSNLKRLKVYNINMLKYIMGIPIENNIILTQNLEDLVLGNTDLNLTKTTFNFEQHIDFKIATNSTKANELLVKYEKSKYLPSLVGFINYGVTSYADTFKFFDSDQKWYDSSVFGVSLNVPIFSSFQRNAKVQQAKIDLNKAERNLNETAQKLKLQHQAALTSYQNALNNYATAKESLALAERIETKENIKFFEGVSSSFALSNAQTQLYQQQQNYLQSIFELISSKVALETALNN